MREQWRTGWRKWTLISVAGLSAVLLTMLGALESGVLNDPILWLVGQVSGYELSCSRLSGSLLSRLSCQNLALADQRGVFLTARKLVLDWNGAAVLANRIEIHKLSLTDSRLTRLPKSGKTNADHVLPSIAIAIGRIDIQHFVLENFKGPPACVDLEGRAAAGPDGFDTDLKLVRCHPLSGQLVLRGHYVKATGNVMLRATAHDDGRALVQLLGLKRVGPARLSVQLAGTLPALSGRVHLSLGAIGVFDAHLRAMGASRTLVDSRFHVASGVLPDFTPHADGRISATLSYAPRQGFLVRPLTAVWGSLSANGEVGADAAGRLRGHIIVTSSGTQTISGTRIGSVSLDLNLGGSDTSPALSGTATLRDIASAKAMLARITGKLTAARTTEGALSLGIAGEASGTRLPAPVAGLIGGRFKFAAQVERAAGGQLTLAGSLTGNAAHAQWTATLGTTQGSGALTLRIPDLARAGTGFGGSALARLTLDRLTLGGTLHGTIQIEGHAITASGFGYALGHAPRISAQIAARDGSYRLSALKFDLAALSAHGALSLARSGALAADVTVTRGELAPLAPLLGRSLAGSFTLRARASGTWQSPVIAVDATSAELHVGSNVLRQVRLAATAQNQSGWRGRLRLAAATTIGAINLASALDVHAQGWSLSVARGEVGPARLAGAIAMNRGTYSGALTLKGDLLAPAGLLLGQQAAGVGTLRVQGLGRALQVSADIRQMSVASLKGASLKALATLQDGAGPVRLMVRLRDGTNALLARAQARLTPLAIQLNALQGTWAGFDFNLRTPTSVTREQGRFQLARTMLSVSGGDLVVTARGDTKTLNAHLQLTKLPVAPLAAMLQVHHASGMLAASLNVALTPTSTLVHLQADGRNMVFASASKSIRPADFTFVSDWNGTALDTDGRITGFSSRPVTLNLHLPLVRRDGSFVPSLAASGAVRGALVIPDLDAGRLSALLPLAEESVTGIITADVRLVGDVIHPRLDGSLQIEHGSFSALRTGTRLTELDAKVVTRPSGLADLTLNAKDGGSGTLKASGQISLVSLLPGPSLPLTGDLKLQLNNAELVREDLIHGAATGTLEVKLPMKDPVTISGKLRTDTVHVDLGAAIPPAIPTIKVHYVGQRAGARPLQEPALTQSAVPTVLGTARLDIGIAIPNRLYIAGRGLNSEWGGHLNIFGTVAHPAFRGQVQVINGTAEVIGKTFTLQSGLVHISNDLPGNAEVNVAAQYTSTNLAVTLTITGPATDPKINWSSVPALPKSDILSNLIFGAGTPQLSLGQAFQLAQMSGALSSLGVGGGDGGLLGFARNLTGLDVLNVSGPSSTQGTGASVTAGKYIGGRVYVGVTQGASTSASSAEVRVTVAPHVTVTGTVGANNANSLGVDWLWRY